MLVRILDVKNHGYADDIQLYRHSIPPQYVTVALQMLTCIDAIRHWLSSSGLKLNLDKTEFIWIASPHHLRGIQQCLLTVETVSIMPVNTVRDLGVMFDSTLDLHAHVTRTVQSCFFQLRQLKYIRHSLSKTNIKTLLHAFVASRLDYCNALLAGMPANQLNRLQSVQNCAAHLYSGSSKYSSVSHVLRNDLHWLCIPERVTYKLCTIVYRCLHSDAPKYLADYCVRLCDGGGRLSCNRSAVLGNLEFPRTRTKTYGHRNGSFRFSGPVAWSSLPPHLTVDMSYKAFNSQLKTYFYKLSHP